uniref:GCC2 and GCC3 domain-containing protein n=1 Tax=Toxoplasma gondii TgCATBr9 TaxID=943120 RepID=A0A2T6ISP8_TOXGO|nr:GCC2 and GCC3 domain-containing protein [Toxoplasma gondii TgCATBr9]
MHPLLELFLKASLKSIDICSHGFGPAGHFCKVTPPTDPTFPTTAEPCPPDSFSINTGIAGNSSRIFASEWTREAGVQTVFTTNGGGLCRTETADFSLFTNVRKADGRGLPSDALASIIEGDNLFWIVTAEGQGVVSVDNLFSFNPITLPRETTLLGYGNHRLWAGSSSSAGLWVSKDRGWSFSQVAPAISSATVFASDPVSGYLCVGDSSTVFCSGDNFEAISATSALAGVRALLVLPGGDMVVAATAAHVFQSRDGGRRFTRVTSLRGAAVRLLSRGANEVFVASTQGVSKSTDRGASFAGWARNLPPESLPISDFHVQADAFLLRHSSGFLRSSTGDNWQPVALPTDSPCGQFPVTHSVVADFRLPAAVPETSGQCIRGSLSKAKAALVSKPGEMILNGVVVPCREGFFCPETCDETNQVVLPCPAGTWCESGVDRQPSLGSHPCPRGHYCPEATDAPVKCPAGTYNHELHQATADACRPAPAGYSIDTQGAAEPLQLCPAGNFCPEGTSDGGTVCPPGTSR